MHCRILLLRSSTDHVPAMGVLLKIMRRQDGTSSLWNLLLADLVKLSLHW
ncbi:hypothetical protein [Ignatzschineria cameli]|nr:hypothetical protein [Ignatzschineria cameli]